jgi:hypothetical protein
MKNIINPNNLSDLRFKTRLTTLLISSCMIISAFLVANFLDSFRQFVMYYPFIMAILIVLMVFNETKYRKEFEKMVGPEIINTYFKSRNIKPLIFESNFVSENSLRESQLTQDFDNLLGDDYISFAYKGKKVEISDVVLRSKGKNVDTGVFVLIDFKRELPGSIYAINKDLSDFYKSSQLLKAHVNQLTSFSQLSKTLETGISIYTDNFDFSKDFYSKRMVELQNKFNKNEMIELFISGSIIYIFINNRSFSFSPPISVDKPVIDEVKNKVETTLDLVINMINELEMRFPKVVFAK